MGWHAIKIIQSICHTTIKNSFSCLRNKPYQVEWLIQQILLAILYGNSVAILSVGFEQRLKTDLLFLISQDIKEEKKDI